MTDPKKILIIDDEMPLLKIMEKFSERLKWVAVTAESGEKGKELFLSEKPESFSGVIIDYNLPNESSEQILSDLKEHNPQLKCVLSTGFSATDISNNFTKVTVDYTLQKPFSLTDFKELLDKL
ncbi:MAG: response regulator [Candidatus Lokiarchaeota archaeon]|nr:response regulator [Candidatus Harpocratesius repetitus]